MVIDRNELLTGVGIGRGNLFRLEMPVAVSASEFIFGGDRVARPAKRGQRPLWNLRSKLVSSSILLVSTTYNPVIAMVTGLLLFLLEPLVFVMVTYWGLIDSKVPFFPVFNTLVSSLQ